MKKNNRLNIKNIIYEHVINNSKEYILVTLIFLIGIFLGVMFINNIQEVQMSEITSYLNNFSGSFLHHQIELLHFLFLLFQ